MTYDEMNNLNRRPNAAAETAGASQSEAGSDDGHTPVQRTSSSRARPDQPDVVKRVGPTASTKSETGSGRTAYLPRLGVGQWFHYEEHETLDRAIEYMHNLGVREIRTGLSWADYHRPRGRAWYDRQMEALSEFNVVLSIWHTPPSIAEGGICGGPPKRLRDFADFVNHICQEYGEHFDELELWNEPNNRYKWDFERFDPMWRKFGAMMLDAAYWAKCLGRTTVLGGMVPIDRYWLQLMQEYGALDHIDVVAIHGFPGMWWPDRPSWDQKADWNGWQSKVDHIKPVSGDRPIWITETGLSTWELYDRKLGRFDMQCDRLADAARAPVERVYWYSLIDLDPSRPAIEGFHVDENEYHLGLVDWKGERKPAFDLFKELLNDSNRQKTPEVDRSAVLEQSQRSAS